MPDDMPIITLSDFWLARAREVGLQRHGYALQAGLKHYGNKADDSDSHHVVGAIAECAVAKYLNLPWRANVGNIHGVDVGDAVEVRARRVPGTGTDLAIRPHDKDEKPVVLVFVFANYQCELRGWIFGHEGKNVGPWNEAKCVWFVPPPYRPVAYLHNAIKWAEFPILKQGGCCD
jgi:hypothetical protein